MKNYTIARLRERSTWLGLIAIVTAFGYRISPEQAQAIITVGLGLAGLIHTVTPDA